MIIFFIDFLNYLTYLCDRLNLSAFPGWVAGLIFTGLTVVITNLCSNTATANVFVPILADLAITMCLHPVSALLSSRKSK